MKKGLKGLLGIGALVLGLSSCPTPVPSRSSADINYRAEVIEGSINISLSMTYGVIDGEGDWVDGQYTSTDSGGSNLSRTVITNTGRSVRLKLHGQSNNPGKVRLRIKDDLKTVAEEEIDTVSIGMLGYSINGKIEYYIPKN